MSEAVERLLCEVFRAQGLKNPSRIAHRAAEDFDRQKRDERIYEARGSIEEIADAHHMSKQAIKNIRSREHRERRAA